MTRFYSPWKSFEGSASKTRPITLFRCSSTKTMTLSQFCAFINISFSVSYAVTVVPHSAPSHTRVFELNLSINAKWNIPILVNLLNRKFYSPFLILKISTQQHASLFSRKIRKFKIKLFCNYIVLMSSGVAASAILDKLYIYSLRSLQFKYSVN